MSTTLPSSARETEHMRAYAGTKGEFYQGWRTWECDHEDSEDLEGWLWENTWTINGHVMSPVQVTVLPKGVPDEGRATARAQYQTLYNPVTHPVGVASLVVESFQSKSRARVLHPDKGSGAPSRVVIPSEVDTDGFWWDLAPESAKPLDTVYGSKITVRTAYPRAGVNWNIIMNARGKYNTNPLPILGGADARTMLLVGAAVPRYYLLDTSYSIVPINYVMLYNANGWQDGGTYPKVQKMLRTVVGVSLADPASVDEATGEVTGWFDEYGEAVTVEDDAKKVPTVRNLPIGDPIDCKADGLAEDGITFQHLMGLLTWAQ